MKQMEESSRAISPLAAILAVIATFILSLFLGAIILILFGYPFAMVSVELLLIVIPLGYMLYKKVDIRTYMGIKVNLKIILLGIALGIFLFLFDVVISNVLVSIFGVSEVLEESNDAILNISSSSEGLVAVIVALSLAGLCEEFTFRGFLQTAINSRYSSVVAVFVSSLAFGGLIHFDPQGVYTISAFLMGLVLGYIYCRWHSYVISATTHSTLNLVVLAIILFVR